MANKQRIRCKYPMSQFYNYEDEIPKGTRVSTSEDCERCELENCNDGKHCLISD